MLSATLKKLRYRAGARVLVHGATAGFEAQLAQADEVTRVSARARGVDVAQVFFTRRAQLVRALPRLAAQMAERGVLWICYPKGRALGTDLDRDVIRTLAAEVGLEAVAICAIDEVWSALRLTGWSVR
jgi:hypothetical protein